ncbi:MAG: PH domain-containing protein [Chloroflexota bacterium]
MVQFSAPWSRFLKIVSGSISVLLCLAFWFAAPTSTMNESAGFRTFLIVFPLAFLGIAALFIIRRYEINDEYVEIVRVVGRKKFRLDNIKSIEANPTAMDLSIRTFGNGGMYSFSGFFRTENLGGFRAYVSNKANSVVIQRKKGSPIVVSPHDPISFVEQVNARI